jgi:hypothetical protein
VIIKSLHILSMMRVKFFSQAGVAEAAIRAGE